MSFLERFDSVTITLISLAIMLFTGFLTTRITKKLKLPNVSGFILSGILIGPNALNLIPKATIASMSFVGDVALAFIAFDVGKFLKKKIFMRSAKESVVIVLLEALIPGILISLVMYYVFSYSLGFSLLLGAIATSTAPASTMMTINQFKAKGEFVNTLLQVVVLDDIISLVLFSVAASMIGATSGDAGLAHVLMPIIYNVLAIFLGVLGGIVLKYLLEPSTRSTSNRLILVIVILLTISGVCTIFEISPLLACMVFGATYTNITDDESLYIEINYFTPPIFSLFFVLSGMNLDLNTLYTMGIVGVVYFFVRIFGKYTGAYLGCVITNKDDSIKKYLGYALVPQAGVSIGLAFLGQRLLPTDIGDMLMTIILSSAVLYELVGPVLAKYALVKSGAIKKENLHL